MSSAGSVALGSSISISCPRWPGAIGSMPPKSASWPRRDDAGAEEVAGPQDSAGGAFGDLQVVAGADVAQGERIVPYTSRKPLFGSTFPTCGGVFVVGLRSPEQAQMERRYPERS